MASETNWAGNHVYRAVHWYRPNTLDQLQAAVAEARSVGVVGSRHSFNPIADSTEMIDLGSMPVTWNLSSLGDAAATPDAVTVSAHATYAQIAATLDQQGLALHNLASLPHLSIAGAIATATHGSGDRNPNLSSAVRGVRFVDACGELRSIGPGDADLAGAAVSLGALGVMTDVTLAVEPRFDVAQYVYENLDWGPFLDHFDTILGSAYSVSAFTRWTDDVAQIWCKHRVDDTRPDGLAPGAVPLLGACAATQNRHPIQGMSGDTCTPQRGVPGPWFERLPHFRIGCTPSAGDEIQSEFFVARSDAVAAVEAMRAIGAEVGDALMISEIRTVAADGLWMSPHHARDSVGLHFTWIRDALAVGRAVRRVEEALAPFDPRPHWGKFFHADALDAAACYERLGDFLALVDRVDPERCFRTDWFDAVLAPRN